MADSVDEAIAISLQLRKAKSTAGRGDPSASISAAIALGGPELSLIVETTLCRMTGQKRAVLGGPPSRKQSESGNTARESGLRGYDSVPQSRPTLFAAATLARAECAAIAIGKCY